MSEQDLRFAVFIDYDNLQPRQKAAGILHVVTCALTQTPIHENIVRAKCDVRIYGGWYEGSLISRAAETVTVAIQLEFPKIIRRVSSAGHLVSLSTSAELAVALLEEPSHHLFNTYRRKGRPGNLRVETPQSVNCHDPACLLPQFKRLLQKGRCPKNGCVVTASQLVYRDEQKLVDTMLTCDIIYAANNGYHSVILISGDDDFLPPLRTIVLRGANVIRFHPKLNNQRQTLSFRSGAKLIELEL